MKMLFILKVSVFLFFFKIGFSQSKSIEQINWKDITSIDSVKDKLIFIDLYTDWCGWCKELDRTTFRDTNFIKYINENYHPVKFNAEDTKTFSLKNKTYKFLHAHRIHEFAVNITSGRLSFPMIIILYPETYSVIPLSGYRSAADFEHLLKFFNSHTDRSEKSYLDFKKNFKPEWK